MVSFGSTHAALTMEYLNKTYGELRALRDLSMEVRAGEIVGFVGSNGAGKSTTMRIVLGVLEADSGEVRWDGKPVDLAVRRRIGYMPEERGLYPRMKVSDQLVYLARLHGLAPASAKAAMEHWTEVLGIAERRGDEILKLSPGQPAARAAGRRAGALPRHPGARRAVLRPRPRGRRRDERRCCGTRPTRACRCCSRRTSSSSSSRLCDRVGIIKAGSMVQFGEIEELRRTDDRRWVVDGPPAASWISAVPSARAGVGGRSAVGGRGAGTVRRRRRPGDPARRAGRRARCTSSALLRPSLTELYRHVVSTDTAAVERETVSA